MEALEDADGRRRPVSVVIGIVSFFEKLAFGRKQHFRVINSCEVDLDGHINLHYGQSQPTQNV